MKRQSLFENRSIGAGATVGPVSVQISDYKVNGFFSLDLKVTSGAVKLYYKASNKAGAVAAPVAGGGVIVSGHASTQGDNGRTAYAANIGAFRMVEIYAEALNDESAEIEHCELNMV